MKFRLHKIRDTLREGLALDITHVDTATQHADVRDNLPGTTTVDTTDTPSTTEPELIKKLREALHRHPEVKSIINPWHGVFSPTGSFEDSYATVRPVPTSSGLLESEAAFKKRKADIKQANKHAPIYAIHRHHLHFNIKLD